MDLLPNLVKTKKFTSIIGLTPLKLLSKEHSKNSLRLSPEVLASQNATEVRFSSTVRESAATRAHINVSEIHIGGESSDGGVSLLRFETER